MIFPTEGLLTAKFNGTRANRFPELVEIGNVPHAVIEHREKSFLAVPLDRDRIYTLPEVFLADGLTNGYRGVIDCGQAVEVSGEVWIIAADKNGGDVLWARADEFLWC